MTNSKRSDELLRMALEQAVSKGYLHQVPVDHPIITRGLAAVDEVQATSEPEKNEWPHWANWRLVLNDSDENAAVIYFTRKPTYAEKKAFCAIAGVIPDSVESEERI